MPKRTTKDSNEPKRQKFENNVTIRNFELPTEMLFEIFKHLTLSERKSVKLVCRRWNETCRAKYFRDKEKFFFGESHLTPITKLFNAFPLSQNDRHLHLEFSGSELMFQSRHFWDVFGPCISTISFINCRMTDEALEQIIKSCTNLSSMKWCSSSAANYHDTSFNPFNWKFFHNMVKINVVHEKLVCLEVDLENWEAEWYFNFISEVFAVFPNIVKLHLSMFPAHDFKYLICELSATNPSVIPKLEFSVTQGCWTQDLEIPKGIKISDISVHLNYQNMSVPATVSLSVLKSVSEHLKSFEYDVSEFSNNELLTNVLNECPKLRFLKVRFRKTGGFDANFLRKLLNSSLHTFVTNKFDFKPDIIFDSRRINRSIRILNMGPVIERCRLVSSQELSLQYCMYFFYSFPNVEHLSIGNVPYKQFKKIMEYMKNLKSLTLTLHQMQPVSSTFEFVKRSKRTCLDHLVHLKIICFNDRLIENAMRNLSLKNLRCLEVPQVFTENLFAILTSHAPLLECLLVTCTTPPLFSLWFNFTSKLKELRVLSILYNKESEPFTDVQCEAIFKTNSNFRYFELKLFSISLHCYWNTLKNKISFSTSIPPQSCVHTLNPSLIYKKWSGMSSL